MLCIKLRRTVIAPGCEPLTGLIEVDEAELPCRSKSDPPSGGGGCRHQGKILIAGAVEIQGDEPGLVCLSVISGFSIKSLHAFLGASAAAGAAAKTDGWSGYPDAPDAPGVAHDSHVIGAMAAHIVLPWNHRVVSNLKTWALDICHALRREHIQAYLESSSPVSIAAEPITARFAPCSASVSPSNPSPARC